MKVETKGEGDDIGLQSRVMISSESARAKRLRMYAMDV